MPQLHVEHQRLWGMPMAQPFIAVEFPEDAGENSKLCLVKGVRGQGFLMFLDLPRDDDGEVAQDMIEGAVTLRNSAELDLMLEV